MVSPSRRRRLSAYAVPALAFVAVGFVAVGVRIGDGAVPIADPRSPATPALSRPVAQISESSRTDAAADLAAAIGAIGELTPSRDLRPVAGSPAQPGALPAPLRSPQPAPAPGTSPPTASPPGEGPSPLDPPSAAGALAELVEGLLQPVVDQTAPVTDPVVETIDPLLAPLDPLGSPAP